MAFDRKKPKPSASARGYDHAHRKARAAAFGVLPEWSLCARCGKRMWKWAKNEQGKSALHFDHNDQRDGYLGFSHEACNTGAGAAKGSAIANQRQGNARGKASPSSAPGWRSRVW